MNIITDDLYKKMVNVTMEVKKSLKKNGVVIPVENSDGSITLDNYVVVKEKTGFYTVLDFGRVVVADGINLPQTAILIANNLALGKFLDKNLLTQDRQFGYAQFEETLYNRSLKSKNKKNQDQVTLMLMKLSISKSRKEKFRRSIITNFEKLRNTL